jgi:hypothetical protein
MEVLPGNRLNLWRGFGVEPKPGDWSLIESHMLEVLSNGDKEFFLYLKRWTAWKLQNADQRPEVALVIKGKKGAGKGVFAVILLSIFGAHGLQVFNPDHVTGKHNLHLQNRLFLHADEAVWAGNKQAERTLKGMVTEQFQMIEPKGVDAFQWLNRLGIFLTANEKWVVPASPDERRYAVQIASSKYLKDKEYFNRLFAQINDGGAAAMLHDMLAMDLDGWHPRQDVPQNEALIEQKIRSLDGLEGWAMAKLSVAQLPNPFAKNPRQSKAEDLLEDAKAFSIQNRFLNETEFGRFLKEELGCQHKSDGRKRSWVFPPLPLARRAWEAKLGGSCAWISEAEEWGQKTDILDES